MGRDLTIAPAVKRADGVPIVPDYDLIRRVGAGAYGEIWLARSSATGVLRAAKIVWRHTFDDDRPFQREFEGIQRFERISREHPDQLALFHIGRNEARGYFYYIMELADAVERPKTDFQAGKEGQDPKLEAAASQAETGASASGPASDFGPRLSHLTYVPRTLRADLERGRLPAARVLEIGLALTEALANLHGNGLVHRDVKPSNVIFVNGRPKLADIGLVTDAGDGGSIVGTEGYLPPEGPGTPQADLFALGRVLYEAATGLDRRQFPRLPPDLRSWPDGKVVLELNEIFLKACATRLDVRYRSAEDVHADLGLLKTGQSVKRLRAVERRLALLTRAAVVFGLCVVAASGIFFETYRQRKVALSSLVRSHVANGTHLLNEGDLFGSLLSFTEALKLDSGDREREQGHRIRIASVLRECPKLVGMFVHSNALIYDAAFSPDSRKVVTVSEDHTAQMWDLATGRRQFVLAHKGPIYSVCFSPGGKWIATASEGVIHFWNAQTGASCDRERMRHLAWGNGPCPVFSLDGLKLLTLSDIHTVCLWDSATGRAVGEPLRHEGKVSGFMFSRDGRRVLTLSGDHFARLWDARNCELIHLFGHQGNVNCAAFAMDGRVVATGGDDQFTRFWDLASGKELTPALAQRHPVDFVAFSPEGDRIATVCRDRTVDLWDLATRGVLIRPLLYERRILRADFTPDGRWLAVCSEGNRVRLWDTDTGELLPPPLVHDTPRRPVIFSSDGHLVLTLRHDLTVEREEIAVVWSFAHPDPPVLRVRPAVSFRAGLSSDDHRFKAILNGDTVRTFMSNSDRSMTPPLKQSIPFRQAAFSTNNTVLLTESAGARGQLWDLTRSRGEPLTPMLRIVYDPATSAPSKKDLPREDRSPQDLLSLAELLSGNRVDENGGFSPVDRESLMNSWASLKARRPAAFSDSTAESLAWHERQARDCEQAWNWWSALFHLKVLLDARPGDPQLQHRLAYAQLALDNANRQTNGYLARRCLVIPPRNPQAGPEMVDLSSFYNRSKRGNDNTMAGLPSGIQTFDGVRFDVRGVVQLDDRDTPGSGQSLPRNVLAIPVNQTCRRLHFLHATGAFAIDTTEVSSYVVHYADGRSQSVTNRYGRDLRCWWTTKNEPLEAKEAKPVWVGTNRDVEADNAESLRIFKRTWKNPWPEVPISCVDFMSDREGVWPFLVAMTAD